MNYFLSAWRGGDCTSNRFFKKLRNIVEFFKKNLYLIINYETNLILDLQAIKNIIAKNIKMRRFVCVCFKLSLYIYFFLNISGKYFSRSE